VKQIRAARHRLEHAADLPAVLAAACAAFEDMLAVIQARQDQLGPDFAAYMLAGASAADGRFAVIAAPSLPPPAVVPAACGGGDPDIADVDAGLDAGAALAGLARVLAGRLGQAATMAAHPADRAACADAAWHAGLLAARLGGPSPR
jgi:hypothetical protein